MARWRCAQYIASTQQVKGMEGGETCDVGSLVGRKAGPGGRREEASRALSSVVLVVTLAEEYNIKAGARANDPGRI
jgi:hypothetical protein